MNPLLPAALALALALPAGAGSVPASPTDAVARVGVAGYSSRTVCTGFALEDGTLVTAAHCLPQTPTGMVQVVFGYDRGESTGRSAAPAQNWTRIPGRDIALLCPGGATASAGQIPTGFPVPSAPISAGDPVEILGYGLPREHVLQHNTCEILGTPDTPDRLVIDCALPRGTSGAPVLRTTPNGYEILGLLFASTGERGLAERITPTLVREICAP